MPNYLSPGVYVEEVSSGSRPIEGVGTAVAGFVGFAEKGPVSQPTLVTNWTQFTKVFGRDYGNPFYEEYMTDDAEVVIVGMGTLSNPVRVAIREMR